VLLSIIYKIGGMKMREQITVHVEKLNPDVELPIYANLGDSGMDIHASEGVTIYPNETKIIPTGLKVAIPDGYEIQVRPRSGLSLNTPLRVSNAPGTIDSLYRNEIGIIMTNTSNVERNTPFHYSLASKGNNLGTYTICKGDRIAQIVLQRVPEIVWQEVNDVKCIDGDRNGGFGSTGI
jgi:dUTP pyrophosphatase